METREVAVYLCELGILLATEVNYSVLQVDEFFIVSAMTTQVGLVSNKLLIASPAFPWLFTHRKSVANEVTEILLAGSTVIIFRQWSGQFAGYCLIPIVLFVEPLPQ